MRFAALFNEKELDIGSSSQTPKYSSADGCEIGRFSLQDPLLPKVLMRDRKDSTFLHRILSQKKNIRDVKISEPVRNESVGATQQLHRNEVGLDKLHRLGRLQATKSCDNMQPCRWVVAMILSPPFLSDSVKSACFIARTQFLSARLTQRFSV